MLLQIDAATSIVHGGLTYDNAHKLVWGFNQDSTGKRLLAAKADNAKLGKRLLGEEDKVCAAIC